MSHTNCSLDVVIVNWNSGDQLRACLQSLSDSRREGFEFRRVVVVDNASVDGSAENLDFPRLPLVVIRNKSNRGFGAASNKGASGSAADYILFLNPDTRVNENTIAGSVEWMQSTEAKPFGIAGVQMIDERGEVHRCCSRFPTLKIWLAKIFGLSLLLPRFFPDHFYSEWDHASSREVDQVQGSYMLIRRHLFESLGGFDELFFVYYEDVDLSLRAKQAGWRSYHYASVQAFHAGGGTSRQVPARRLYYSLQSRLLYAAKHCDGISNAILCLLTLFAEPLSRVCLAVFHRSLREIIHTLKAYAYFYRSMPQLLPQMIRLSSAPVVSEVVPVAGK